MSSQSRGLTWVGLPRIAQLYVAAVIGGGVIAIALLMPEMRPDPVLFATLLLTSCLTSAWKVNLPIPLASGSTLAVSYAADLTALLLLGPGPAVLVALAGACAQCTVKVKVRYPLYRTAFSMAAVAMAMFATGIVYERLGGTLAPQHVDGLAKPLLGAVVTCFVANTGLIAIAIALSTRQSVWKIWHHDFLWSGTSFIVAGTAGAIAAVVIANGRHWEALVLLAPIYLIYRTYLIVIGRLEDQRRHLEDTRRLHDEAVTALAQARRAEQALTAEKERLAVTLRSIADGVVATDSDGTIVLFNHTAETMTGWLTDAAIGKPLSEVFHSVDPETRARSDNSIAALTAATAGPVRRCTVLVGRDLTERPIEESAAVLHDDRGRTVGMVLVFRDITNALRVMEERARANKLSALGLLAGGIANDFNNILMALMGNIELAKATTLEDDAAAAALKEAERACVRARHLTWQLLTFSRGGIPTRKTVRLPRLLTDAVDLALRGTNVDYTMTIDPDLWSVDADETQLGQVLTNLLINAQEAMPHGGTITVRAVNVVETAPRSEHALHVEAGRYVDISIADTGIGIPTEHLPKIFDPYFSTKEGGSGLGLATSYSIIKNHGGLLLVDSRAGHGTTMSVRVPAAEVEQPAENAGRRLPARRRGRPRVLVMDDEPSIRRVTGKMLEYLGYHVEVVESGSIAVERFRQALNTGHPFDVVMLDLMVPRGMGGRETMDRLSRLAPTVKAVLMSGYAQQSILMEYRDHGFGAVMTKPFTLEELNTTLRSVLTPGSDRVH
jgi:PAS domain S-box-containing protein